LKNNISLKKSERRVNIHTYPSRVKQKGFFAPAPLDDVGSNQSNQNLSPQGTFMTIDQFTLTKGQVRKLNALRKSIGDDIAEDAFSKWMKSQTKTPKEVRDPVADALVAVLDQFKNDKTFRLGAKGYVVKRSKGKGASGFVAQKVT
jgi:hypothetical protein